MAGPADKAGGGAAARTRKLPVPEVTGLALPVAAKVLSAAGFPAPRVHYVEAYAKADTVVSQQPDRGGLQESDQPVTVHVAKTSMIRYLPAVYRPRTEGEPSFLRDFLWIVQHQVDSVSRRIDAVPELFHPSAAPAEFLPWLASWFAISFDETMPEAHRRRILKEAPALFRIRGTKAALVRMVKLFAGLDVEVEENRWPYRGFRIGSSSVGVDTMILPEVAMAHTFVVRVPKARDEVGEDLLLRLHRVIEAEKPASTNYFLQFTDVEGVTEVIGMRIGVSSAVGVEVEAEGDGAAAEQG
jgi:phage tail-like protein